MFSNNEIYIYIYITFISQKLYFVCTEILSQIITFCNTLTTGTLERNPHITLAHVNPEVFLPLEPEPDRHCSMWFIGLLFAKTENLNIDLTYDIKSFVEISKFT